MTAYNEIAGRVFEAPGLLDNNVGSNWVPETFLVEQLDLPWC
jgi:hypothetical protein